MSAAAPALSPIAAATAELAPDHAAGDSPIKPPEHGFGTRLRSIGNIDVTPALSKTWGAIQKVGGVGGKATMFTAEQAAALARKIYEWICAFLRRIGFALGRNVVATSEPTDAQLQGKEPLHVAAEAATADQVSGALSGRKAVPIEPAMADSALMQAASSLAEHVDATMPLDPDVIFKEPAVEYFERMVDDLCKILAANQQEAQIKREELDKMISDLAEREGASKESIQEMLASPMVQSMLDKEGSLKAMRENVIFLDAQAEMATVAMKSLVDAAETFGIEKPTAAKVLLGAVEKYQLAVDKFPDLEQFRSAEGVGHGDTEAGVVYSAKQKESPSGEEMKGLSTSPFARLARIHQMDVGDDAEAPKIQQ
ncbi:hypothetical protein QRD43_20975 [Pelomonas sp. APW6]|uniref:Uncharacterized protein n=1 Tax=Roseateles subflavus TaxID=3053353 RepID=A0ABT7LPP4_9BURK|nr:hypothetical protein [Pelomonas sp. APW6]MDL5034389.1 hypothetical protein [Pelomonas sp. APW6]